MKSGKPQVVGKPATSKEFLDHHRNSEEWPALSAGERGVGAPGGFAATVEIAHDDRVELGVERINSRDDMIG